MAMLLLVQLKDTLWNRTHDYVSPYTQDWHVDPRDAAKVVIGAAVTFPVVYLAYNSIQYIRMINFIGSEVDKLPGEPKHWLYGNLHQHPGANEASLIRHCNMAKKYKSVLRFWFGPIKPVVSCLHPDTAKIILRSAEPKSDLTKGGYLFAVPWLGHGLLLSRGQQWARNRRLLTPAFHFDVLKPYVIVYNKAADILIGKWLEALKTESSVEVFTPVSLCTLDIILRCAFSFEDNVQSQGMTHPYVDCVTSLSKLIVKRNFKVPYYFDAIYYKTADGKEFKEKCDYSHKVSDNIIAKRKQTLKDNPDARQKRYLDFLDILLLARDENGDGLTDLEMRNEVDTFLFEGHDTTASAISWCLHALAGHPEFQSKAREEIKEAMRDRDTDFLEWENVADLPYLTRCIKESMRLVPPVPFIGREITKPMTIEGVTLKPGTFVDINIWAVHHNEHVWGPDHMEYKPDRFLPENINSMDSFSFIAFSAGPRNCIGQNFAMHEIKIVVAKVLLAFDMRLDPDHVVEKVPELIIRARTGIKLILTPLK